MREAISGSSANRKPLYSFTAPYLLTGAPLSLLKSTRWPEKFAQNYDWKADWERAGNASLPWMIVEEDEAEYLAFVPDSAWCNVDTLSNRHAGRASIAHSDGSVTQRAYQRGSARLDAWRVQFHLTDGRIVSAGHGGEIHFGFLRHAPDVRQ